MRTLGDVGLLGDAALDDAELVVGERLAGRAPSRADRRHDLEQYDHYHVREGHDRLLDRDLGRARDVRRGMAAFLVPAQAPDRHHMRR